MIELWLTSLLGLITFFDHCLYTLTQLSVLFFVFSLSAADDKLFKSASNNSLNREEEAIFLSFSNTSTLTFWFSFLRCRSIIRKWNVKKFDFRNEEGNYKTAGNYKNSGKLHINPSKDVNQISINHEIRDSKPEFHL